MKRHAFTLVELLVVVAIIALLISILLPSLNKARGLVRATVCQTNLRQVGLWAVTYHTESNGILPTSGKDRSEGAAKHSYWWISDTQWYEKVPFQTDWRTYGYDGGDDRHIQTKGALFCPQFTAAIPQRRVRATHTDYALNKWLGGGFRNGHSEYFRFPKADLLISDRFWFIDAPLYRGTDNVYIITKESWDGEPNSDRYSIYGGGQTNPWPWRLGDPDLGESHPNGQAMVLFGDTHSEGLTWEDAYDRFDQDGDGKLKTSKRWTDGERWAAYKLGDFGSNAWQQ